MPVSYLVPAGYGEAEFTEKRSRFTGRVWRTDSEAEALARIRETREAYRDATHNVYAYIIRENSLTRYSDDGEPGGTSGMPTLNVFAGEGIQNVCCVVTRYFGGTLLGTGGLSRAYSKAAKLALEAAGVARMAQWSLFRIDCAYGIYEPVRRALEELDARVKSSDFGEDVRLVVLVSEQSGPALIGAVADISAGQAHCKHISDEFLAVGI